MSNEPITVDADVLAVAPSFIKSSDPAPVRDGIMAAMRVMFTTYQGLAAYCAAQSDVLTATGPYLDEKLEYERGIPRHPGEEDEDYRFRGLSIQETVTPTVILAAVNAIIAPLTCSYLEPTLDGMFIGDDSTTMHSYVGVSNTYLDRFYPDDTAANLGFARPGIDPGKTLLFDEQHGRYFVLRVPDLAALDVSINYSASSILEPQGFGLFFMTGTAGTDRRLYSYGTTTTAQQTYELIVTTVERLRGTSFKWAMITV